MPAFRSVSLHFIWLYLFRCNAYTLRSRVLINHDYKSTDSLSWVDCVRMCSSDQSCFSYNYMTEGEEQGLCQLNNCGFQGQCSATNELLFATEYVYQQLRQPMEKQHICGSWNRITNPGIDDEIFNVNVKDCPKRHRKDEGFRRGFGQSSLQPRAGSVTFKACQHSGQIKHRIACAGRFQRLHIQSVMYGRPMGCVCHCGVCQNLLSECSSDNALGLVQKECRNKKECFLQVNNSWFGQNPCKGFKKHLTVVYSCD